MISREQIAKEYIKIIHNYYPVAKDLLSHCLIKVIELNPDRFNKHSYYLGIYYPDRIGGRLLKMQGVFQDAAENMGLIDVVFININSLIKDPHSKIKQQDFRFWLELCWLAKE